jgi:hypothetical protein
MATLPKVLINRADYQIGGRVALGLRTQGSRLPGRFGWKLIRSQAPHRDRHRRSGV